MEVDRGRPQCLLAAALLFLLCAGAAPAQQRPGPGRDERDLLALEDHWLAVEDDPDSLERILASDFVHALPIGFVTKAEQLDFMRRLRGRSLPPHGARRFEDRRVRVYGDVGIVNGIVVEDTTASAGGAGGERRTVFTDVFVRREGRWQAVNAQELPFRKQ